LERELRVRYFAGLVGRRLQVMVESPSPTPGRFVGTSCRYAPVELACSSSRVGELVDVTATSLADGQILGELIASGVRASAGGVS
jgi:hypothetical protein